MGARTRFIPKCLLFFVLCLPGWAQASFPENAGRHWALAGWISGATGEENTNSFAEAQIFSAGFVVGRVLSDEIGHGWRRGRFEYGFGTIPLLIQVRPGNLHGVGFEPVILRWNSSLHTSRWVPYLELAGGGLHTNSNVPAGDTSDFNFMARVGGGIEMMARGHRSLDIGCRWLHISNANLGVRNPEFNGIQVMLGYRWRKVRTHGALYAPELVKTVSYSVERISIEGTSRARGPRFQFLRALS
jgi:hypothetical protein